MNKLLFAATAALTLTTASADTHFKTGATAGAAIGYSRMSTKTTESLFLTAALQDSKSTTKKSNGFMGEISGGYRILLNEAFMIGLDLALAAETNKTKTTHESTFAAELWSRTTKLSRTFSVTPSVMAGYIFAKQWMAYAKLGMSISRFKLENHLTNADYTIKSTKNLTKVGFKPALGVEHSINSNVSAFAEGAYEFIPTLKMTAKDPSNGDVAAPNANHTVKVKPHIFTLKTGVIYKF